MPLISGKRDKNSTKTVVCLASEAWRTLVFFGLLLVSPFAFLFEANPYCASVPGVELSSELQRPGKHGEHGWWWFWCQRRRKNQRRRKDVATARIEKDGYCTRTGKQVFDHPLGGRLLEVLRSTYE